jgi:signal recognition particle subunit SRP54
MTLREREDPDLLNNSRKERIAKGCGLTVVEVNRMIKQFKNAGKMAYNCLHQGRFSKGGVK